MTRALSAVLALGLFAACGAEQTTQGNRPPAIALPGPQLAIEGTLIEFSVSGSDPDDDPVQITAESLPENASFAAETGRFLWVPSHRQAGNYNVVFAASDGRFSVQQAVSIAVLDNNRPPAMDALSEVSVVEGQVVGLSIHASDPDGDTLTMETTSLPRGATFDPAEGKFSWRPAYDQAGSYSVTFVVTDAGYPALSTRGSALIRVENYTEPIIATNFPITGPLGDGARSGELSASTLVLLDFSAQTDLSPTIAEMRVSNVPSMADASWQTYEPLVTWQLPPGDGAKTVYARFRDMAENVSARVEGGIELDTTAPFPVGASLVGPAVTNADSVLLALSAQDKNGLHATEAVTLSEDPSFAGLGTVGPKPFPSGQQQSFPLSSGDGPKEVFVRFRDAVGNNATVSVRVVRDTEAPIVAAGALTVSSPRGNGYASNTSVTVHLVYPADALQVVLGAAADAGTCAEADLAGKTPQPVTSSVPFLLPAGDGLKRVCGKFLDTAGNPTPFVSGTIVLDTGAPTAVNFPVTGFLVDGSSSTTVTAETSVLLDLAAAASASPDVVEMKVSAQPPNADEAGWQPFAPSVPWILAPGADGPRTVYARFRDRAGNPSNVANGNITLDTTGPVLPAVELVEYDSRPANGFTNVARVRLRLSAGGSAVRALAAESPALSGGVSVDMAGLVQPVASENFPLGGAGERTVWVRFYDAAGNASELAATRVVLDTIAPAALAATLVPSGFATATAIDLVLPSAGQDEARVTGDVSGSTDFVAAPADTRLPLTLTSTPGTKNLNVFYRDLADNVTSAPALSIVLDGSPPAGCALTLVGRGADGSASPAEKTARANVTVTVSGCTETPAQIFLTGAAVTCSAGANLDWVPFAASLPYTLTGGEGTNTVRGCVRDAAQNVGGLTADTIDLDTIGPTAPSVVIDGGSDYINAATVSGRGGNIASVAGSATGAVEWAIAESTGGLTTFASSATSNPRNFTFAGTGPRTLYAVFRDDVKNLSPIVSDAVNIDTVAPTGGSLTIITPNNSGYTNSVSVIVQVTPPSDAAQMILVSAGNSTACGDSDLAGRSPQPTSGNISFLLSGADGTKRACAKFYDAAGNASAFVSATTILDQLPPTAPLFITVNQIVNAADGASFTADIYEAVSDLNFEKYQRLGGKDTSWADASTSRLTTSFAYRLVSSASDADGVPNLLRLRATDKAGNFSAEAAVIITTDSSAPAAVILNQLWTQNGDRQATVYWKASTSSDVAGYRVYYGPSSGVYNGQGASNGTSPFNIGNATSVTLAGLINASPVFVRVRAVDRAGNEGASPTSPTEIVLQPNDVSPTLIWEKDLALNVVRRLAVYGNHLYAWGPLGACTASNSAVLQVLDISNLVSPVQGGSIRDFPPGPTDASTTIFADAMNCPASDFSNNFDLAVDGMYLYASAGRKLRVLSLADPRNPQVLATLDDGSTAGAIAQRADKIFKAGRPQNLTAYDLSSLYDGSSTSRPAAPGSVIGTAFNGTATPTGMVLTRDKLVQQTHSGTSYYNIGDAIDNSGTTAWDNNDRIGSGFVGGGTTWGNPIVSGNFLYSGFFDHFAIQDLTPLWGGVAISTSTYPEQLVVAVPAWGSNAVAGGQVFLNDNGGVRSLDLSDVDNVVDTGPLTAVGGFVNLVHGNYLFHGSSGSGRLQLFEIATPRSPHIVHTATGGGNRNYIVGGFVYTSHGSIYDLQGGGPPPVLFNRGSCAHDGAIFGEDMVQALSTSLKVIDFRAVVDRNLATSHSDAADTYTITLPAPRTAHSVYAVGSYLVDVGDRTDGVYLEVFDARKVADARTDTFLAATDTVGTYKVTNTRGKAEVTVHQGRALVTVNGTAGEFHVIDIRPLLDDDASTMGPASHQGMVTFTSTSAHGGHVVANGDYAYLASETGLLVIPISQAMDENASTTIAGNVAVRLPISNPHAVAVYGSYAFVMGLGGLNVVDISTPTTPAVVGFLSMATPFPTCSLGGMSAPVKWWVSVRGSRAYVTGSNTLRVLELE